MIVTRCSPLHARWRNGSTAQTPAANFQGNPGNLELRHLTGQKSLSARHLGPEIADGFAQAIDVAHARVIPPSQIDGGGRGNEIRQFSEGKGLAKFGHLSGGQFQIYELNIQLRQAVFKRVEVAVEFCLGPVQRVGGVMPCARHGLNFLQQHRTGGNEQPIDPAPDLQGEFFRFHRVFNGQFSQIPGRPRALDFLVAANAGQRAFAYLLLERLRTWGLAGTELAQATVGSVRLKLLKVTLETTQLLAP